MVFLLTLAATLACLVAPARAAARDEAGDGGDSENDTGAAEASTGPSAWVGAARGWGRIVVHVAGRTLLLISACVLAAILVGLIGNRIGAFYPTWGLAWADIGPALW